MNQPEQTWQQRPNNMAFIRELAREMGRIYYEKNSWKLKPHHYIRALNKAAPGAWKVRYNVYHEIKDRTIAIGIVLGFLTAGIGFLYLIWRLLFQSTMTEAHLQIDFQGIQVTSQGSAKHSGKRSERKALIRAIKNLMEENDWQEAHLQEARPQFS